MLNQEITFSIDRKVISAVLSVALHVFSILAISQIQIIKNDPKRLIEKTAPLVVESISQEQLQALKNIRTVGKKDGKENTFGVQLPRKNIVTASRFQENSQAKNILKKLESSSKAHQDSKKLDLASLAIKPNENKNFSKALKNIRLKGTEIDRFLKEDNQTSPSISPMANPFLANSGIDVQMEIPKGVNLNELNQYELQFYSFQKRTAMSYISSFYSTLNKYALSNPHLKIMMSGDQETLTSRVTFDKDGNIKAIKFVRTSTDDKTQEFFDAVIEGINRLPNPPKTLVENGEFVVYYTLVING